MVRPVGTEVAGTAGSAQHSAVVVFDYIMEMAGTVGSN